MNPHILLALLSKLDLVPRDKAKALAEKLTNSIQPARFDDAEHIITAIFEEVDK